MNGLYCGISLVNHKLIAYRQDICIDFADERFAFELKLSNKLALTEGKTQLVNYLQQLSLDSGWLIIFSRKQVEDIETVGKREIIEEQGKRIEIICL